MSTLRRISVTTNLTENLAAETVETKVGSRPKKVRREPVSAATRPARRIWFWGLIVLLTTVVGLAVYFQPWSVQKTKVTVETVVLAPATRVLAVNGRIAAVRSVNLRPLVGGTLAEVSVAEGDVVQAGTELARIDDAAQQAFVRQAQAGLDAALLNLDEARSTYARTEALGTNAARTVLEAAARTIQTATQEVARMTALLDQAKIQLRNFIIRAPMAGTVLVLNVDPGQVVETSTALMSIADLRSLVVETDVDETFATQIHAGQTAALELAGETTVRDGKVSFVSQRVDAGTGGLAVKLSFDAPVKAPIGLTVTANIVVDRRAAALTVPQAAILKDAKGTAVFVVSDGIARRRAVSVIDWPAARLIVTAGLRPGDAVITDATGITDGQAVLVEQR